MDLLVESVFTVILLLSSSFDVMTELKVANEEKCRIESWRQVSCGTRYKILIVYYCTERNESVVQKQVYDLHKNGCHLVLY